MVTLTSEYSFPTLKEITGSLVIYYVKGTKTLGLYFPNLTIIRGQTLAYNYAVVIKETNLLVINLFQYIGLVNLRLVMFGGVRIDNNPSLCYVNTINWTSIVRQHGAPIKLINMRNFCLEFCPNNCPRGENLQKYCWHHNTCQNVCSESCAKNNQYCFMNDPNRCCHPECLGGCYGEGDEMCVSCKNVLSNGRCVKKCDKFFYKYKNRRCISESECMNLSSQSSTDYRREDHYAIEDDACVKQCSPGKQQNKITGRCEICGSECSKKYCGRVLIHSINDFSEAEGCYSIEDIYISIKEGGSSLSDILMKAFSKLTIIENSLRIVKSSSITSLDFLRSLRIIKGNSANKNNNETTNGSNKSIVFEVYDNENLVEIFDEKVALNQLNITILEGSVSFNLNRKLCPEKILSFLNSNVQTKTKLSKLDERIINVSNGDMAFCKHEKLIVQVLNISDSSFTVKCHSKVPDISLQNSALTALFMLKETTKNVSQYELFNSCSEQNWRTVEGYIGKPVVIDNLLPAKRYAFYAEAIRSRVENWLEISDVIYLTTERKNPSQPINLKTETLSSSEIRLTWNPPLFPNGEVTRYIIWYRSLEIFGDDFFMEDVCFTKSKSQRRIQSQSNNRISKTNNGNQNQGECDCDKCMESCNKNQILINIDKDDTIMQFLDEYITKSFIKQNEIPKSNWKPVDSGHFEIKKVEYNQTVRVDEVVTNLPATDISTISKPSIENLTNHFKKMVQVPANETYFKFTNLHHYTEYFFEIQACQDLQNVQSSESKALSKNGTSKNVLNLPCSSKSLISAHTSPKENMDNINESTINTRVNGSSVKIFWSEPKSPNGFILNYFIRYRKYPYEAELDWLSTPCVTRPEWLNGTNIMAKNSSNSTNIIQQKSGFYTLRDLKPGKYEFQIKPFAIATEGAWTKSYHFKISSDSIFTEYRNYFIIGAVVIIIILCALFVLVCYYCKKKYLERTRWVSSNPDYWIIYEIDVWEIDRKDVDMLEWNYPLGRGSFGMVYKGVLKNLTTPARDKYLRTLDEKQMFVAVKTLNTNSTILERREFINEACYMKQFQSYHLVKLYGIVSKVNNSKISKKGYRRKFKCFGHSVMSRVKCPLNWNSLNRINILKLFDSKASEIKERQIDDIAAAQFGSFKATISQHFDKMPLVIMELMEFGDLAGYLRKQGEEGEGFVSENQSHLWAIQIADGMLYLSEMKFVHRDLAARNCMINSLLIIKIGDFGMARDVYYDCYYRKENKGRLPVRWMAPESLLSGYFSKSSDLWSYGVILWEILTLASLPYRGMSHHDVIQYVSKGGSLLSTGSFNSSKLLLGIMENCWLYNPDDRPSFFDIIQKLELYADMNFRNNSYYFQKQQTDFQTQEQDLLATRLESENSTNNFIQDS
uniref:receptor protein-tyrosine kinase n=1 Tax=Schmidtea mediterranea TaxID=79327 RepID=I1T3F2_SCHMD|nr:insulin receptor-like 1 protein [Schmidtea mediterranea]